MYRFKPIVNFLDMPEYYRFGSKIFCEVCLECDIIVVRACGQQETQLMSTKLKIDLTQGILEVEGSETFVKAIYSDFKVHFIGDEAGEVLQSPTRRRRRSTRARARSSTTTSEAVESGAPPTESTPETEPEPPAPAKPTYKVVQKLDLSGTKDRPSLVEFMDSKFPITNEERNLVFLYYLQHLLKTKAITADHIYTCYKEAKIRVPLSLESSLKATANQHRWIKMTKTGRLSVTPSGKLYVEKQLPKKLKG